MKHALYALIAATIVSGLAAAYATRVKAQTPPADSSIAR
jgi:hypothetical protein